MDTYCATKDQCHVQYSSVGCADCLDGKCRLQEHKILPVISNQKMNAYLKEIAVLCEINKNLTTHTARHTFATVTLASHVSIENVSKMLGHTNLKITQHYAKILDNTIMRDMENVRETFRPEI